MNKCTFCEYKVVSNSVFERHLLTHQADLKAPEEPVVFTDATVVVVEPTTTEVVAPEPVQMVSSEEITIRFKKPVEVYINAVPYVGQEVKIKNMSIAAEIVRITREAYGPDILA